MFLLVTIVSVTLGYAYAGFVGRRFGLKDWRHRAAALTMARAQRAGQPAPPR